jgi:hypothetical protein
MISLLFTNYSKDTVRNMYYLISIYTILLIIGITFIYNHQPTSFFVTDISKQKHLYVLSYQNNYIGIDFLNKRMFHPLYLHPIQLKSNYKETILDSLNITTAFLDSIQITKIRIITTAIFKRYMMSM